MEKIKNVVKIIGRIVGTTALSTLTSCVVRDVYNNYKRKNVADTKTKRFNLFNKNN